MTNPKEKTREELQAEIEDGKKKIRQFENREKMLRQKLSKEERRTRSHRLIVRGAVFESIVPEAKNMTDEEAAHHNAVFVGRDEDGVPRYAHQRGTAGNFRLDVKGSDKAFNFCYRGEGERLFVFEAPIDLLSFLCLFKKDWQKQSYLALGGVGDKALMCFLSDRPNIKTVYLCLDSDKAGNDACSRLVELMPEGLTVHRLIPLFKDWNEVQTRRGEIADGKYIREAIYGLKEPPQEETVEIIRMSEVDTQTVEWLWKPYIPFGKVTIVQGNPGEGKTTFALRLAVACSTGGTLPGMKPIQPFQVIYQTAEDGLGDTRQAPLDRSRSRP